MLIKNLYNKIFHEFFNKVSTNSENIYEDINKNYDFSPHMEMLDKIELKNNRIIVLMVDDNLFLQDSTKSYLEKLGMTVDCAENGLAGFKTFLNNSDKYDLILLDIEMPVMDGIETAKGIRKSNCASSKTIPIIAVTGSMFADNSDMPLFNGNIKKPFEMEQLVILIKKTLLWSTNFKNNEV